MSSSATLCFPFYSILLAIFQGNAVGLGFKKAQNFKDYYSLYPEYTFVFIGDNGQGDVVAAELMAKDYPDAIDATYIHIVQPIVNTPGSYTIVM